MCHIHDPNHAFDLRTQVSPHVGRFVETRRPRDVNLRTNKAAYICNRAVVTCMDPIVATSGTTLSRSEPTSSAERDCRRADSVKIMGGVGLIRFGI